MTTRSTRSPRRRTVVALAVVLAVLAGFIVRLVDIQVVNADDHIKDSLDVAFAGKQTLYGTRGSIVDESGQTLAGSILRYDCQIDPLLITQIDAQVLEDESDARLWADVSNDVAEITGQTPEDVRAIVGTALALCARRSASRIAPCRRLPGVASPSPGVSPARQVMQT